MTDLTMPKLSDSMEEGTILTWLKADGDEVQAGEDLLEIETDKATVTHQAEAGGTLQIIAPEGTTLPVGVPIARVSAPVSAPIARVNAPVEPPEPAAGNGDAAAVAVAAPANPPAAANGSGNATATGVRATPLARRAAEAHGVSLQDVTGTGPLGRITRGDVLSKAGVAPAEPPTPADPRTSAEARTPAVPRSPGPAPRAASAEAPSGRGEVQVVEPTRLQSTIARRMAEAKATVPHFQVQTDVVMDAAVEFRAQIKDTGAEAPSFNDLVVKAAARALKQHPFANASYRDGHFELYSRVNVGIAVAADHALVVPTIFDADQKSLGAISAESRRLADRVRSGEISPAELSSATFTVSNLGMYGMTAITPVVNPPQAAILGVGAMRDVLARVDGEVVDRRLMTLTLSCDHRILYGADAAEFLSTIKQLLEQPLRLVL
jgi:pyruvate dehydrogenase E2 component (dihydrolipoamide acetyltransferase)